MATLPPLTATSYLEMNTRVKRWNGGRVHEPRGMQDPLPADGTVSFLNVTLPAGHTYGDRKCHLFGRSS
jgi:hypothetical protein